MFKEVDAAGSVDPSEEDLPAVAGGGRIIQCYTEGPVTGHGLRLAPAPWHCIDVLVVAEEIHESVVGRPRGVGILAVTRSQLARSASCQRNQPDVAIIIVSPRYMSRNPLPIG